MSLHLKKVLYVIITFNDGLVSWWWRDGFGRIRRDDDGGGGCRIRLRLCRLPKRPGLVRLANVEQVLQLTIVVLLVEQLGQNRAGFAAQRRHVIGGVQLNQQKVNTHCNMPFHGKHYSSRKIGFDYTERNESRIL